jgi:Uma2 family endonuclease
MGLPEKSFISDSAYLEMETASLIKHEYYNGDIFAMAGASIEHNKITSNLLGEFLSKLKGSPCKVFTSDLRINVVANTLFTYPDINVICGDLEKLEGKFDTVTNPTVLVEVLSESIKDYDRGSKFMLYRDIPSLKEFILVDSTGGTRIEKYAKIDNVWQLSEYKTLIDIIHVKALQIEITMGEVYNEVYE